LGSNKPFRVAFLLVDGFALLSYAAAVEPLRAANLRIRQAYELVHVAAVGKRALSSSGAVIDAVNLQTAGTGFDLVLVVAGGDPVSFHDADTFAWLRRVDRRGALIGGVSGGPAVLARAGLMAGRRMTVHWEHAGALKEFDSSLLLEPSLYVRDRNRLTCAGGTAALDMMHALLAEHHGVAFARQVSDWFLHTDVRPSEGPQRAGLVERYGTVNASVISAIEAMQDHVADPLSLSQVAARTGSSVRQLNRLFRDTLDCSTMTFYLGLRLDKARELLTQSTLSVTQVALATGFRSAAHFSQAHRRRFKRAPSRARTGVTDGLSSRG
jgi:transcriptional regulator GlxA family with amidase domain